MEIFISRDGQQFGPYPVEQVRELLNQGILQATDLAWHEGLEGWISLGELTASAPGGPPPPIPAQPEPTVTGAPAKAGGNIKLFIGLGAAMAVLAIAAGTWLLLAPKKEQLAGSDPKPNAPASQNPKGKAPTVKLTPEEAAEVMAWEIGTWESQGEGQPAGGRPNPIAMTKEVRWKEEGKSLEYKFSLVENGKPVTYFGHQAYDAAMGVFVYRSKWGNNPETTSHEVHDITTGISRGISVPTPANGEPSTAVLNKRVGNDQSEQTLKITQNGQVIYSHQITSTRINTAPTQPTLLGKKIIGKRFILEAGRDEDTKQKVILQFREDGIFEVAQIRDGEVRPDSDEMTFKINGLKARVFENGKEDGGITFNSDNPAIGDLVTFGSARRQTAGTILSIEPAKPLSQTAHAESKPGTVLWEFETGDAVSSSPAIGSDGTVYVGSWDKKLYAINGKTGVKLWEFETGRFAVVSSPAIGSDGTVYVGSDDNKLYAINGKTGVKLWEFETGVECPPPPPSALMARFTSGHGTKSSMPSMARLGSSYGNLKREIM